MSKYQTVMNPFIQMMMLMHQAVKNIHHMTADLKVNSFMNSVVVMIILDLHARTNTHTHTYIHRDLYTHTDR